MDTRLTAYATAHGGVFSWADAQRFCIHPKTLAGWVRAGTTIRVRRNAYVVGATWDAATPDGRALLRIKAILHGLPSWVASHQTALAVHGLPLHDCDLRVLDVLASVAHPHTRSNVRSHPRAGQPAAVEVEGFRTVPIPWAITQVTLREGVTAGVVALDAALHDGMTCVEDVRAAALRQVTGGQQGRPIERLLALAEPRTESVGETLTRLVLLDLGFSPVAQVPIIDSFGDFVARVDFLVHGKVVVEFDGAVKYAGHDGAQALAAEKAREDRLRALGYAVVRLTWADLAHPTVVLAKVQAALAWARPAV